MPSFVNIVDTFPPDLGGRQGGLARLGSIDQWDPSTSLRSAQDDTVCVCKKMCAVLLHCVRG
jgi:hypothetical protein